MAIDQNAMERIRAVLANFQHHHEPPGGGFQPHHVPPAHQRMADDLYEQAAGHPYRAHSGIGPGNGLAARVHRLHLGDSGAINPAPFGNLVAAFGALAGPNHSYMPPNSRLGPDGGPSHPQVSPGEPIDMSSGFRAPAPAPTAQHIGPLPEPLLQRLLAARRPQQPPIGPPSLLHAAAGSY